VPLTDREFHPKSVNPDALAQPSAVELPVGRKTDPRIRQQHLDRLRAVDLNPFQWTPLSLREPTYRNLHPNRPTQRRR
jgi:hypothetical protein